MEARADTSGTVAAPEAAGPGVVARRERHPHLYLEHEGGTVIFLVEQTLFKVHEYFFKHHSAIFASMFTLNPGDAPAEGRSDERPIELPDASAVDFERLLSLFYPRDVISGDLSTLDEWTSVLRVAHKYVFEAHRELAITRLATLAAPIDRILLAREYDIPGWLVPAYYDLCTRDGTLTYDEGVRLGMADVIRISDLRQHIRGPLARLPYSEQNIRWTIRSKISSA